MSNGDRLIVPGKGASVRFGLRQNVIVGSFRVVGLWSLRALTAAAE